MASFRKLPSGAIRAEIYRQGKRTSKSFPAKQAAKEWAAREEFLILEAAAVPLDHGAFGDALQRHANEVSPSKRSEGIAPDSCIRSALSFGGFNLGLHGRHGSR